MDLTTLARVKARASSLNDSTLDTILGTLIAEVSADAETRMARHAEVTERTEIVDLRPHQRFVRLPGAPISEVSEIKLAATPAFTDVDALTADEDYFVLADTSQLHMAVTTRVDAHLQVTYTGGMAADTAAFVAAFPDIAGAVEAEVVNRFRAREVPEGDVVLGGQAVVKRKGYMSLPIFVETCQRYRLRRAA